MIKTTLIAIGALVAAASLAPVANAGCNWQNCNSTTTVDVNVTLPDNFAFGTASSSFNAAGDGINETASMSTTSSAAAASTDTGAGSGVASGGGTVSAGTGNASGGATISGGSSATASAGPAP
jgi:hypothetical protein